MPATGVRNLKRAQIGHREVRVYRGTGVSRGVRRTTWERSLKIWELQIPCFEEFFWGGNTLGLVPASLPHTLGYACTFYTPTFPPPTKAARRGCKPRCFGACGPKACTGARDERVALVQKLSVATPAEPRGEKKLFLLCEFWAVKNFYKIW